MVVFQDIFTKWPFVFSVPDQYTGCIAKLCEEVKVISQYDTHINIVFSCDERQIVNAFSHLQALASVDCRRNTRVEKMQLLHWQHQFAASDQSESFIFT